MPSKINHLLGSELVKREYEKMPILTQLIDDLHKSEPLKGQKIGFSHVLAPNTVVMIVALLSAGGTLEIMLDNGLTHDERIVKLLEESGIKIYSSYHETETYDFVVDCGGYFVENVPTIGSTEVTRTGIHKYNSLKGNYRLIDVDSTQTKLIETFLGNPIGVINTFRHFLPNFDQFIVNKIVGIVGFGKIGRGSARIFKELAHNVIIMDINKNVLTKAKEIGFQTFLITDDKQKNSEPLSDFDLIITSTGHAGVMSKKFDKYRLKDGSLKINLGAEDEWGDNFNDKEIFYSKSKPFNFNLSPPTPSKYIDPILTLHLQGLIYLVKNYETLKRKIIPIPPEIDKAIVDEFNRLYDDETSDMKIYFD